jgi:hypothetical protein
MKLFRKWRLKIITAIQILTMVICGRVVVNMGFGINTWQYWCILLGFIFIGASQYIRGAIESKKRTRG